MKKTFCDMCGSEMHESSTPHFGMNGRRLQATVKNKGCSLTVEVIQSKDGCANAGDFCKYCVISAIASLDDRPKQILGVVK